MNSGLRGLSTPEAANAYVPEFIEVHNERFGRAPLSNHDVHRPVRDDEDLGLIFTCQEDRKISKELTLHFRSGLYLIEPGDPRTVYRMPLATDGERRVVARLGCPDLSTTRRHAARHRARGCSSAHARRT